jgi:hypothetical protein
MGYVIYPGANKKKRKKENPETGQTGVANDQI